MASDAQPDTSHAEIKWYYRPLALLIAFLVAGPFVIPLVCLSPALKRWQKIAITIVVIVLTAWLLKSAIDIYKILLKDIQELQASMNQ